MDGERGGAELQKSGANDQYEVRMDALHDFRFEIR
jgi:hypothetical protein